MIDKSEQINELATALSKAQAKLRHVAKDKTARIKMKNGGEYSYNYADLGSTWDAGRLPLTENGLSVSQLPSFGDGWLMLDTILMHASGQYISSQMRTRADEMDVKSIGSAITYLRRYAFAAIIGLVADEDDDGDASSKTNESRHARQAPPEKAVQKRPMTRDGLIARFTATLEMARALGIKTPAYDAATMSDGDMIRVGTELKDLIELERAATPANA